MSEDSPYTFHAVGAEGEPTHYELRDVSGRVVCKAFLCKSGMVLYAGSSIMTKYQVGGYTLTNLEEVMREFLHY
jgi:hypothetical protein